MKCMSYEQTDQVLDAMKDYNEKTYAKPSKITATVGLTADGKGYEISLPWFEITAGIITNYGLKTYKVPQLFDITEDGSGLIIK